MLRWERAGRSVHGKRAYPPRRFTYLSAATACPQGERRLANALPAPFINSDQTPTTAYFGWTANDALEWSHKGS